MHEASAVPDHAAVPPAASPDLKPVAPAADPLDAVLAPRVISLGGPATGKLRSFTLSTRLQGRSVLTDTDLTRD